MERKIYDYGDLGFRVLDGFKLQAWGFRASGDGRLQVNCLRKGSEEVYGDFWEA